MVIIIIIYTYFKIGEVVLDPLMYMEDFNKSYELKGQALQNHCVRTCTYMYMQSCTIVKTICDCLGILVVTGNDSVNGDWE